VTVAAVIADRLQTHSFEDVMAAMTEEVLEYRPRDRAAARHVDDVIVLVGKAEARKMIAGFLRSCYPSRFADVGQIDLGAVTGDEEIGWFYLGYDMGKEIGEQAGKAGFSDWWWEWNGELDDAFFNWLDTLGASSYGPGDFNPPAPGGGLPA